MHALNPMEQLLPRPSAQKYLRFHLFPSWTSHLGPLCIHAVASLLPISQSALAWWSKTSSKLRLEVGMTEHCNQIALPLRCSGTGKLNGRSEILLGRFLREYPGSKDRVDSTHIATKLAIYPWRVFPANFTAACRGSLRRLEM